MLGSGIQKDIADGRKPDIKLLGITLKCKLILLISISYLSYICRFQPEFRLNCLVGFAGFTKLQPVQVIWRKSGNICLDKTNHPVIPERNNGSIIYHKLIRPPV